MDKYFIMLSQNNFQNIRNVLDQIISISTNLDLIYVFKIF